MRRNKHKLSFFVCSNPSPLDNNECDIFTTSCKSAGIALLYNSIAIEGVVIK